MPNSEEKEVERIRTQELNSLRCMACECALKLYEGRAIEQLEMLKKYVDICLKEAIKQSENPNA